MSFGRFEILDMTGDELIQHGKTIDAYKQPINPITEYKIKMYVVAKKIEILSKDDFYVREQYDLGKVIYGQGGLLSWANFGCRLGFFEEITDCIESVEKMIECFNGEEDYEKSAYFKKELEKLKNEI